MFCDIRPTDYTIDPDKIEDLVTEKTCAIVPVHVYGNVCNDEKIEAVAKKHNLKVIYDAAHAFGVEKDGVPVGRYGDASMFSFHATKVFNTIEGGCVCYSDPTLTDRLSQWRNFGITGTETVEFVGGNAKMNEFCAAMGICNLRHVDEEIAKRKLVAEKYFELLADVPGLDLCVPPENIKHNYSYMPVVVSPDVFGATRDDVFDALAEQGIERGSTSTRSRTALSATRACSIRVRRRLLSVLRRGSSRCRCTRTWRLRTHRISEIVLGTGRD